MEIAVIMLMLWVIPCNSFFGTCVVSTKYFSLHSQMNPREKVDETTSLTKYPFCLQFKSRISLSMIKISAMHTNRLFKKGC